MNLFKLSAKILAILGLLVVRNLVIASPLNISSVDPSDDQSGDPSDDPSVDPSGDPSDPYWRCDPGRGRGQFSPNFYSKPPWPKQGKGKILSSHSGIRNVVRYKESRDVKVANSIDLLYCLSDMYHGIYPEEPGISDAEHYRRKGNKGYKREGWYCRGIFFEIGFKGFRYNYGAWKVVEACKGGIVQAAIKGRPWVNCQVISQPTITFFQAWFGWSPAHCKMRFRKKPECDSGTHDGTHKGRKYDSCMHPPCPEMCPKGLAMPTSQPTSKPTSTAKRTAEPTSEPTSKPDSEPTYQKPTSEPGDQKPALEPVCTNYCGGLSKAKNGTNNVLDGEEEWDTTPTEEA